MIAKRYFILAATINRGLQSSFELDQSFKIRRPTILSYIKFADILISRQQSCERAGWEAGAPEEIICTAQKLLPKVD